MSQAILDLQSARESAPPISTPVALDIFASVQMNAEPCRVLYALAIPEYMEAWLQFPDMDRIECHSERRSYDRFRIDLFCAGARRHSIFGSCLLSKPNRITYLWEREHSGDRAGSVVEIRLWGDLNRCNLKLKHSGFRSPSESESHSRIWHRSLNKLSTLMERIAINQ